MSKPKLSDLKEIEMKDMSSFGKEEVVTVKRVVKICGNCQMVYINEQPRILCLYCGNFYDAKTEREKNRSFVLIIFFFRTNQKKRISTLKL